MKTKLILALINRAALLLLLSTLNPQPSTFAQGTEFTYQGRLNDGVNPANGSYDLRFALYDALAVGNAVGGALTNTAIGMSNGLFIATLDFGGVFNGANYWLEIAVRTNGSGAFSTLSPRQPITPTPQAIYAANAGSAATAGVAGSASSVSAANLTGTLADSQLSSNIVRLTIPNTTTQATGGVVVTAGFITGANVTNGGSGYTVAPTVTVVDVSGSNAVITATVSGGSVVSLTVQNAGSQYSAGATLTIAPPPSNAYQTFTSGNVFNGVNILTNGGNSIVGTFNGTFGSLSGGTMTVSNNLNLPATTATAGIVYSGGNTLMHTFGPDNFFAGERAGNLTMTGARNVGLGLEALRFNTSGNDNTGIGFWALIGNTSGNGNTAIGGQALRLNTSGDNNTAIGWGALLANTADNNTATGLQALRFNTSGNNNTANGFNTLLQNTTGSQNTASGAQALGNNTTGSQNTANGFNAMVGNTTGVQNTATGTGALQNNMTGNYNVADGFQALRSNTTGIRNTGLGDWALLSNTTGAQNTAGGAGALQSNTTGSNNIAFGYLSGANLTNGSDNIAIGNLGVAAESGTIRLGTPGIHTSTLVAGLINGNGGGLTNLNASQLASGTVADARLSTNVALLNASQTLTGVNTFNHPGNNFTGNGTGLTNLSANAITGGLTINLAVLVPGGGTNTLYFTNGVLRAIQ